ncbi:uncharacterized protein CTHT_0040830 [Thermochaetoides thermophila DSM 1495]|uniref:Uncharacterized protein n=1 Tax=Chaetomium thermophilum (strain DSM 1495 / CBS 144.50 / IMI 039719) TaxID=759272 RepID=G0SA32_CHATD|nr:hypothetical protein CTHT_0040830 [Thermochaetoides thermophila DSM 1495]EGS19604.1 hypothetical protein CTHT_0040830 [Thermochaetoides thermophila DSM 1495]
MGPGRNGGDGGGRQADTGHFAAGARPQRRADARLICVICTSSGSKARGGGCDVSAVAARATAESSMQSWTKVTSQTQRAPKTPKTIQTPIVFDSPATLDEPAGAKPTGFRNGLAEDIGAPTPVKALAAWRGGGSMGRFMHDTARRGRSAPGEDCANCLRRRRLSPVRFTAVPSFIFHVPDHYRRASFPTIPPDLVASPTAGKYIK